MVTYNNLNLNLNLKPQPCIQAINPCANDASANTPALNAMPTSAFRAQRPTPMPRVGERRRRKMRSQAILVLSMTVLTAMMVVLVMVGSSWVLGSIASTSRE